MDTNIYPPDLALPNALGLRFFFKEEDFDEQGSPIGPLYAVTDDGQAIRSERYVKWAEARQIARHFNAEFDET